MINLKLQGK